MSFNLSVFISKRIVKSDKDSFSSTIHRIAIVSISLSLGVLIVAFSIMDGFKETIKNKVYSLSGHLVVDKYALSHSFENSPIILDDSLARFLQSKEEIVHFQPYILKAGLIKTEDAVQGIVFKGVNATFDNPNFSSQIIAGKMPLLHEDIPSLDIMISNKISHLMNLNLGDNVTLFFIQEPPRFRKLRVCGIYHTGLQEFDENIIIGDVRLLQKLNGWQHNQMSGIEIFIQNDQNIKEMEDALFYELSEDLNVKSVQKIYPHIFDWLHLLNRNVIILLVIILLVSTMGMISMILILIMERTQMIGSFKAMGASNGLLKKIFFLQGSRLIFYGMLYGNATGLLLCFLQLQFQWITLDVENYYVPYVPISIDWQTLVNLNILMFTIVFFTLFIPLKLLSKIQIVKSILYR